MNSTNCKLTEKMKLRTVIFCLVLIIQTLLLSKDKIDYEDLALNIMKSKMMEFELKNYNMSFEKNDLKNAKWSLKYLYQNYLSLSKKDLKIINHNFEKNLKVYALDFPGIDFLPIIIAIDSQGLAYYLYGFEKDHFNKLIENKVIKFRLDDKFAKDVVDLYSKTVMTKYNNYESIMPKSLKIIKLNNYLYVEFYTKAFSSVEIYKYTIDIKEDGLFLNSRVKVR